MKLTASRNFSSPGDSRRAPIYSSASFTSAAIRASAAMPVLVYGLVSVVGVAGGYFFIVVLQNCTPGAYLASFTTLAQLSDLWAAEVKALVFGAIAGIVASYKGLTAKGGPKGVGDAVNQSVVITFMLLFVTNFVMTAVYFQVVPQRG